MRCFRGVMKNLKAFLTTRKYAIRNLPENFSVICVILERAKTRTHTDSAFKMGQSYFIHSQCYSRVLVRILFQVGLRLRAVVEQRQKSYMRFLIKLFVSSTYGLQTRIVRGGFPRTFSLIIRRFISTSPESRAPTSHPKRVGYPIVFPTPNTKVN